MFWLKLSSDSIYFPLFFPQLVYTVGYSSTVGVCVSSKGNIRNSRLELDYYPPLPPTYRGHSCSSAHELDEIATARNSSLELSIGFLQVRLKSSRSWRDAIRSIKTILLISFYSLRQILTFVNSQSLFFYRDKCFTKLVNPNFKHSLF